MTPTQTPDFNPDARAAFAGPIGSVFRWCWATIIVALLAVPLMILACICYAVWYLPEWPDIDQP